MTATSLKETVWVDAWVRWERNSKEITDEVEEEEEEDDEDLPPPTETYTFTYPNPKCGTNDDDNITIEINGFHSDSEQSWCSTGLQLWRSSHHLCQHLVEEEATTLQDDTKQLRILEVGSGLGRCGLLAHRLSHDKVQTVLTDGDTETLKQLRKNVEQNTKDGDDTISCRQLLWGEEQAKIFLEQQQQQQQGEDDEKKEHKFDIVIGSDLVYVQSVIKPLFETVQVLLNDDDESKFLMAHCSRREGNEVDLHMVLDAAEEEGFKHEVLLEDDDISVFSFQRK